MTKKTNDGDIISSNLKYLGLNLENIPDFLKKTSDLEFRPIKGIEENEFKVYKYVPINEIQILFSPTNRLNSISEKYALSSSISEYLDDKKEENIMKHATFLKMLKTLKKQEIEKIEKEQLVFKSRVPFKVKYDTNYLWQIYYSEYSEKYFMIVTTEDLDYSAFFYILKKQIEYYKTKKEESIFVPISYLDYSAKYLRNSEISDLEKYIWLFTKDWPLIYEVYNEKNELNIHIVGITKVYDNIKSYYKIILKNKEEANEFFKLLKALFILQTELPHYYKFESQIGSQGELELVYNNKIIKYDILSKFIKEEYNKYSEEIAKLFDEKELLEKELIKLNYEASLKNMEYLSKEKQITTYLECKKTVFGRIRYFFRGKKKTKNRKEEIKKEINNQLENNTEKEISINIIKNKEYYTIEDLLKICLEVDRINNKLKNLKLDITAMQDKIKSLESKIKNATIYIEQIEEHKKSIFEFWKFANKDEVLGLNQAELQDREERPKLKKTFNYEEDLESLGLQADKEQRNIFTKEECDSIYIANSDILYDINKVKNNIDIDENILEDLKEKSNEERLLLSKDNFDIFGNVKEDKTKISILANKKHRETIKNKFKILDITKLTDKKQYKDELTKRLDLIEKSLDKSAALYDMSIYVATRAQENINTSNIEIFNINPLNAINKIKNVEKINLYKIPIKEGMKAIYYSNIMFYDNYNNTLPMGMNISDEVLFDMSRYNLELKRQKLFRINDDKNEVENEVKIICAYEYDIKNINS